MNSISDQQKKGILKLVRSAESHRANSVVNYSSVIDWQLNSVEERVSMNLKKERSQDISQQTEAGNRAPIT